MQAVARTYAVSNPTYSDRPAKKTKWQVRGHKNNPVAWQEWDQEALSLAKTYNRLLFVSIGYAACHCMDEMYQPKAIIC